MTPYIELKIDGRLCDLPPQGFDVTISYRIQDGLNASGANSDRSVSLPMSKQNKAILGELGSIKTMDLRADGIPILYGQAQSTEFKLRSDGYGVDKQEAKVALYGRNADIFARLGDLKLKDLDWSDAEHDLTDANVTGGFTARLSIGSTYGYHVWKNKDWGFYAGSYAVTAIDCVPFLFIHTILTKIFAYFGYTWTGTFLDSTIGRRLILPVLLPNEYGEEYANDHLNGYWERTVTRTYSGAVGLGDGLDFTTHTAPPEAPDPFANSVVFSGVNCGEYTCKVSGYYKIKFRLDVSNFVGVAMIQLGVVVFGNMGANGGAASVGVVAGNTVTGSFVVQAQQGEKLYTKLVWDIGFGAGDTFNLDYAQVEVVSDIAEITYGAPINFKYLLKDWMARDFLRGIEHLVNGRFDADAPSQNILLEPSDYYPYRAPATGNPFTPAGSPQINNGYHTGTQELKWDLLKEHADLFTDYGVSTILAYKEDGSDQTAKALQEGQDLPLHSAKYNRDNTKFQKESETWENPFFAATLMIFDSEIQGATVIKTPCIPMLWNEDYRENPTQQERPDNYTPRILYFADNRGYGIKMSYYSLSTSTLSEIECPEAFFTNYNDFDGTDFSLSFSNIEVNGNEIMGLAQRFYLQQMARTRLAITRNTWAYFTALNIQQLDFAPKVLLGEQQWILSEVQSYNPLLIQSTSVVLQQDTPQNDDDINNLEPAVIVGFLSTEGI